MYLLNGQRITDYSLWSENIVWEVTSQIAGPASVTTCFQGLLYISCFLPRNTQARYLSSGRMLEILARQELTRLIDSLSYAKTKCNINENKFS